MDTKLKKNLLKKYNTKSVKWLFGGKRPRPILYIYESLPDNFIEWFDDEWLKGNDWNDSYSRDSTYIDELVRQWKYRIEWILNFGKLLRKPFKKSYITECAVETKQEYADFNKKDILVTIESFSMAANLLYCAQRDIFNSCPTLNAPKYEPLCIYYQRSLEYLMWLFATFYQINDSNFTDLITKLKKG